MSGTWRNCARSGFTGEQPDQTVTDLHRIGPQRELRETSSEAVVGDLDTAPVFIILPAMVGAHEPAALHLAQGEFELAMRTAILDRVKRAIHPAK